MQDEDNSFEKETEYPKLTKINSYTSSHKYLFRICLLGNSGVGKTSILTRYSEEQFKEKYSSTIGVDFKVITLKYKDIYAKIHVWDTAGQERFKSIALNYFKTSNGFIFCYDITNKESFENIQEWIELAFDNNNSHKVNFLIGNKNDLINQREVSQDEGENFAKKNGFFFLECSAKNNYNIDRVFEIFSYKLISYYEKNKGEYFGNERERKLSNSQKINTQNLKKKKKCVCI